MAIKAIETKYKGYRFRSRLEARWAVFFDTFGLKWEYEKEGFDLGAPLGWYLPDFWLPDGSVWIEIKGADFTGEEIMKCHALSKQTGDDVLMVDGLPDYRPYPCWLPGLSWEETPGDSKNCTVPVYFTEHRNNAGSYIAISYDLQLSEEEYARQKLLNSRRYIRAVDAARSARFEHEEGRRRHHGERGAIQRYYSRKAQQEARAVPICGKCGRELPHLFAACRFCA